MSNDFYEFFPCNYACERLPSVTPRVTHISSTLISNIFCNRVDIEETSSNYNEYFLTLPNILQGKNTITYQGYNDNKLQNFLRDECMLNFYETFV